MLKIFIQRQNQLYGRALTFYIYIDGERKCSLEPGNSDVLHIDKIGSINLEIKHKGRRLLAEDTLCSIQITDMVGEQSLHLEASSLFSFFGTVQVEDLNSHNKYTGFNNILSLNNIFSLNIPSIKESRESDEIAEDTSERVPLLRR